MGISIRAYARQRGISEGAVRKAIKAERIPTEPDGTINPANADAAWDRNTDPAQQRKPATAPPVLVKPVSGGKTFEEVVTERGVALAS